MNASPEVGPARVSLKTALSRVARELNSMHTALQSLDSLICQDILKWESMNSVDIREIQKLDLMVQTIGELGRFVDGLQTEVAGEQTIDVARLLRDVRLEKLTRSLGYGEAGAVEVRGRAAAGEVDFF